MTSSRQLPTRTPSRPAPGSAFLFVLSTVACIAGLVATYYFFVQTATGQFIDESALVEAVDIHGPAGKAATQFLDWLPTISLVMAAVVVLFVTVIRRHWAEAGIAVAACIGANVATQVLKDLLPARPDKGVLTLELNSLPSGHTTLAASAAAAVFLMASPRWRPMAGFIGGSFAIASGASTLINQWHRPADVVAAFLLVGAFMIPAGWLILRRGSWNEWDGFGRHLGSARIWLTLPVLIGLASAGVAVYSLDPDCAQPLAGGQHHQLLLGRDLADCDRRVPGHRGDDVAVRVRGTAPGRAGL